MQAVEDDVWVKPHGIGELGESERVDEGGERCRASFSIPCRSVVRNELLVTCIT